MWPIFKKLWTKSVFEKLKFKCRFFLLGTFCPLGRFVLWDVLSLGRFVPGTFCPLGRFVPWDVLSLGTFCLGTFCLCTGYTTLEAPVPARSLKLSNLGYRYHAWMGDHSSVKVHTVVKNTQKSQERRNGASITC